MEMLPRPQIFTCRSSSPKMTGHSPLLILKRWRPFKISFLFQMVSTEFFLTGVDLATLKR